MIGSDEARDAMPSDDEMNCSIATGIPVEHLSHDDVWEYLTGSAEEGRCCPLYAPAPAVSALGGYTIACEEYPRPLPTLIEEGSAPND